MAGDTAPRSPARVRVVVCVVLAVAASLAVVWGILVRSHAVHELMVATGGLVHPVLINSLASAAMVVGALVLAGGSIRDLGLVRRDLLRAVGVLVVVHAGIQLGLIATALASGAGIALVRDPAGSVVGQLVAQLFGTALLEEAVFRGFLLRQLLARARARYGPGGRALAIATAAHAFVFALYHIPVRIHQGFHGLDLVGSLAIVWLGGVLASYLYLRSGNLLIVVALHALFNTQAPLVGSPVPPQWILCILVAGVIAWIELDARAGRRATAG